MALFAIRSTSAGAGLEDLELVYRRGFRHFRAAAAAIVGDEDAALDVVQEAFAIAVKSRGRFRGEGSLEGWVWRIAVNTARAHRRRRRRPARREPQTEGVPADNGAGNADERLRLLIAALPERQRLVVFLRYYADLEYGTIAEALGIRQGTVAAALHKAHRRLRAELGEEVAR